MNPNPNSAKNIFLDAIEIDDADQRRAFVDAQCGDNEALRRDVERLLHHHAAQESFLESPADAATTTARTPSQVDTPGAVIGPYKLLEQIGEGGFGVVFMAEQSHPVQRRVALKIIKPGMDSKQVVARFEAERQALALMDHVNIARVIDGGTTDAGRPYFVMELVHGVPITKYCDDNHLSPRERLELFLPVCQAIQHAHQKGVIHRDIKPSNVMVTLYDGRPVPKVIDFGVAKATEQKLTERTLFTQYGTMVGTLEYMSPEQAEMSALGVDTRSDIYSLGVPLYELLTGTTPLSRQRIKEAAFAEVLRMIKEEEPPRPSTRLSDSGEALASISAQRQMEPAKLTKLMRGELDWIAMKCLEKDRNRRYETANGLAMDVQRYLADEPVQACPPSAVYRLRKFVRRHRLFVGAAAIITLVLVAGIVSTTIGWVEAGRQRDDADLARKNESREKDRAITAEHLASSRLSQVVAEKRKTDEERAIAQALNDFFLKDLLGQAYSGNQPFSAEFANLNPRITVREVLDRAREVIDGKFAGQPLVEAAVRMTLAETYLRLGEYALAIPHAERALALREARLSSDHPDALAAKVQLARAYSWASRPQEAIKLLEQVRDKQWQDPGPEHLDTMATLYTLGAAYLRTGRREDAIGMLERVYAVRSRRLTPDDPEHLNITTLLASAYLVNDKATEAISLLERAKEVGLRRYSAEHPGYLIIIHMLGKAYLKTGRTKDAIALLQIVRDGRARVLEPDHPSTLAAIKELADAFRADGRLDDAIPLYEQTVEIQKRKLPVGHIDTLILMNYLAGAYKAADRLPDVIRTRAQILEITKKRYGVGNPHTLASHMKLGIAYKDAGKFEQALAEFQQTVARAEKALLSAEWQLDYISVLCRTLEQLKQFEAAERWRRKGVDVAKTHCGSDSAEFAGGSANLGMNLMLQKRFEDAEAVLRPALKTLQEKHRDHWATFDARSIHGELLMARKKYAEAESELLESYEGLKRHEADIPGDYRPCLTDAVERLIRLYQAMEKPDQISIWKEKLKVEKANEEKRMR